MARLGLLLCLVVAAPIAVLAPTMADAATAGIPSPVTTYDASTHVYDGSSQHGRASSAADSRHGPTGSFWTAATATPFRVSPVGVAANAVPPRFITTGAGVTIDRMAVNTTISAQRQGRHVLGAREYGGGSYFNSADDAQGVLDAFHSGGAQVLGTKGNDIVVRVPGINGFNHNPGAGFPNQPTNVFFIKGSSSPSLVPYNPAWKP